MLGLFIIHHNTNGNLTSDGVWSYTYDYENRLVQASNGTNTIAYTYDARGRLIERRSSGNSVTTNRMYYVGWQMIADYDGVGNMRRKYVYGVDIDEPVRMTGSGTNYYYHADALGSITEITGSTGALVESYTYDVYGAPTIYNSSGAVTNASAIGNRRFFTGRNRDGETGLYNLRNRCYSPTLGRFMQTDPSGLGGGDLNLYRYCANNPVNLSDPYGMMAWGNFITGAGAALFGGAAFVGGAIAAATGVGTAPGIAGMLLGGPTAAGGVAMMIEAYRDNPNAGNIPTSVPQMAVRPWTQNLPTDEAGAIERVTDWAVDIPLGFSDPGLLSLLANEFFTDLGGLIQSLQDQQPGTSNGSNPKKLCP